jgi:IS1 family transposase
MNKLTMSRRVQVISALVEGCSIRSTVRMTGVAKNTIVKLLADVGRACAAYHNRYVRNVKAQRIQCDEIWSFVGCKEKNIPGEKATDPYIGDVWTWVGMDADTKLVAAWLVGGRDAGYAEMFMNDLSQRLANRVQLTTDGLKVYLNAVADAFGTAVDYAMLVKLYGTAGGVSDARRYSPPECIGCKTRTVSGAPDEDHISTSYIERQNLTMRMKMRRFTRLTNGFSKKFENHEHAVALNFMHYNYARLHQTLRSTPAMKAGLTDHLWSIEEIVRLADLPPTEKKWTMPEPIPMDQL